MQSVPRSHFDSNPGARLRSFSRADTTQAPWGTRVSASTVSDLNQKIYKQIEEWRQQPLVGEFPYVFLDGLWLKRSWGGEEPRSGGGLLLHRHSAARFAPFYGLFSLRRSYFIHFA